MNTNMTFTAIKQAEEYRDALKTWLANPASVKSNPQGAADRRRELEATEARINRLMWE